MRKSRGIAFQTEGTSMCQGPGAGLCLVFWRKTREGAAWLERSEQGGEKQERRAGKGRSLWVAVQVCEQGSVGPDPGARRHTLVAAAGRTVCGGPRQRDSAGPGESGRRPTRVEACRQ